MPVIYSHFNILNCTLYSRPRISNAILKVASRLYQPVDDVSEEVVVPQPVLDINLLVVNGQSPIKDASLLKETF